MPKVTPEVQQQLVQQFGKAYPRCAGLPIVPIATPDGQSLRPAYDYDDVHAALGDVRFGKFTGKLTAVYIYGHRLKDRFQAPAIHADDLESFLAGGG